MRRDGGLDLYAIGLDKSPSSWVLDGAHMRENEDIENNDLDRRSHKWKTPSRWREKESGAQNELNARVVDEFSITT